MRVALPTPAGRAAAACSTMGLHLPSTVDGRKRRATDPAGVRVAAWGDPAVVLRCGVPRPAQLAPTSEVVEVNGVAWFLEPGSTYVFTTVGRVANVEVRVPGSVERSAATAPLVDLAGAVGRYDPLTTG